MKATWLTRPCRQFSPLCPAGRIAIDSGRMSSRTASPGAASGARAAMVSPLSILAVISAPARSSTRQAMTLERPRNPATNSLAGDA